VYNEIDNRNPHPHDAFLTSTLNSSFLQTNVDFEGFTSALYQVAIFALSKDMYRDLYPRDSDKVQVLLNLWGVADPEKLAQINMRRRLEEQNM
jgi:hypothetical protein